MNEQARFGLREKIAIAVSASIVLGSVVYWVLQVLDVIATLKMAYGG
jgi:hypothetical protein